MSVFTYNCKLIKVGMVANSLWNYGNKVLKINDPNVIKSLSESQFLQREDYSVHVQDIK